ncbi:MerR family transcriptional regulator [Nocardiopsis changdeensis]|uniref:MerR family transcriptional regulator n=1 Tax=Nocardiopsis changdeensis TaxID=2831969 RepID=A0ABX8BWR3_9ACTN|nr:MULTISPECIES: MerR family transcriptional regulator [Nocardiopsis]QUX25567.1 MerR family transcriptional regulator [Nocardiopsis changdeensis]QYX35953.1 MerR family transcriptional regulator [Nocardiopsis sp. MT53]
MATDELMNRALAALEDGAPPSVEAIHRLTDPAVAAGPMTIAEVADRLELSPHTLRYYERVGLVRVARDAGGHRVYDAGAVRRLVFLTRMRLSGMAVRDLRRYVELVDAGEHTVPERLSMLLEHREATRRRMRGLALSLAAIDYKIATYGGAAGPEGV